MSADSANIRAEQPSDFDAIHALVTDAFKDHPHSDGTEQDLVRRLRALPDYDSSLFLVACDHAGVVVGFVAFSSVSLPGGKRAVCLAPLAVSPSCQKRGIGAALVKSAIEACKKIGLTAAFVQGNPAYYSRFGFQVISKTWPAIETQ